jgi:hypothetical protein
MFSPPYPESKTPLMSDGGVHEELVKLILFIVRFRGRAWCRYSIPEPSAEMASS